MKPLTHNESIYLLKYITVAALLTLLLILDGIAAINLEISASSALVISGIIIGAFAVITGEAIYRAIKRFSKQKS